VTRDGERRVVVTGVGVVSPPGLGRDEFWDAVLTARSGIRPITRFDASALPSRIAGEVPLGRIDPTPLLRNRKATKAMSLNATFALVAAGQAAAQADVAPGALDPTRLAVAIGSEVKQCTFDELAGFHFAVGGAAADGDWWRRFSRLAGERLNPFTFLKNMPNMDAAHISMTFDAEGPSTTITTGCTAGLLALAEASHMVRRGDADLVLAGGTNGFATPMELVHLGRLGCLSRRNDEAAEAVRPFDDTRDGVAPGEGAAVFVVEAAETAARRGARPLAELCASAGQPAGAWDATRADTVWTAEPPSARALARARLRPRDVDLVFACGLATREHDRWECASIQEALGAVADTVAVTSIRPLVGLAGAASGALDAPAATLAIARQTAPPLANLRTPDPACGLAFVRRALERPLRVVLVHTIDLDGQGATLVLQAPGEHPDA
jgi:3-oxoacyl-(acyl-carrier-protein) synthase